MPRLSIVIPHLARTSLLEQSLVSVLAARPDDCEVIVVLGRAYGDPYHLTDEVRFVDARGRGAVACVNRGVEASRSAVVHLLAAGAEVVPGWTGAALRHFDDARVAAVAPLVLDASRPDRVLAAGMTFGRGGAIRALGQGARPDAVDGPRQVLCPDPAGALVRRAAFQWAGGLASDLGQRAAMADLGLLFERAGLRTILEPTCRLRARRRWAGPLGAWREGADAERLFRQSNPRPIALSTLALHGLAVGAEFLERLPYPSAFLALAGRLAGMVRGRARGPQERRFLRLLDRIRARAPIAPPHFLKLRPSPRSGAPAPGARGCPAVVPLRGGLG